MTYPSRLPLGVITLVFYAGIACQSEVFPDISESCSAAPSAADVAVPALIQYRRLQEGSLCELSTAPGAWRITVRESGYAGEQLVYTRVGQSDTGAQVRWRRLLGGELADSGVVMLSGRLEREVRRAIQRKDFGSQLDSGVYCTHCASIVAEVRADSSVMWFLGTFEHPEESGFHRALEALSKSRQSTRARVSPGAS